MNLHVATLSIHTRRPANQPLELSDWLYVFMTIGAEGEA